MNTDMTILFQILKPLGVTLATNFIWDKSIEGAKAILDKLKDKFVKEDKAFENEEQLAQFLEKIATKQPNSTKNPYIDVNAIYQDIVDEPNQKFVDDFKQWLIINADMFKTLKVESNKTTVNYGIHNEGNFDNSGGTIKIKNNL